jgi:hypothetical protein
MPLAQPSKPGAPGYFTLSGTSIKTSPAWLALPVARPPAAMTFLGQKVSYTVFALNCLFVLNALCPSGPLPFIVVEESD